MRRSMLGQTTATPFSPLDLDVKVFLMANDSANFFLSSGTTIGEWYDLSGYNNYVDTATAGSAPTLGTDEVVFSGSTKKLQTRYVAANWITEMNGAVETSQFVVFKTTNNSLTQMILTNSNSTFSYNPDLYIGGGNLISIHRPYSLATTTPIVNNTYYIAETDWELAGASPQRLWVDGILKATTTGATDLIGTNYEISIGTRPRNLNNPFKGAIKAVLIFNQKLNDSDRQKVEGYLAHQLGLLSNLPIGHPYKVTPP